MLVRLGRACRRGRQLRTAAGEGVISPGECSAAMWVQLQSHHQQRRPQCHL